MKDSKFLILDGGGVLNSAILRSAADILKSKVKKKRRTAVILTEGVAGITHPRCAAVLRFTEGTSGMAADKGRAVSGYMCVKVKTYAALDFASSMAAELTDNNFKAETNRDELSFTWYFFDPSKAEYAIIRFMRDFGVSDEAQVTDYALPFQSELRLYDRLNRVVPVQAHPARFIKTPYHRIFTDCPALYAEFGGAVTAEDAAAAAQPLFLLLTEE